MTLGSILFEAEKLRHDKKLQLYKRIRRHHSDKDEAWWWDTLYINLKDSIGGKKGPAGPF